MELLISFAVKSLLISGVTLGLLHLLRDRSASERSMVAHVGLLALFLLPLATMFLPKLVIEAPLLSAQPAAPVLSAPAVASDALVAGALASPQVADSESLSLWPLLYGIPVALLLGITLLAVLRLLALRAKASVLVEPSWLGALAHAQRRMDFKHGTALLTSSELKSPISWGVLRPVILLNEEALEARGDAEAIIAHELAHVRGLDWAKLLLARIVTALYWFNPLAWLLAREAHQLREETADDAVLAADVANTDYAQLLVGVARHDCNGLLLGAHGVAPGKGSLARRVRRVLDGGLPRTPAARGFAAGIALGVIGTATPLAAVTLVPASNSDGSRPVYVASSDPQASLPSLVAGSMIGAGDVVAEQVHAALGDPASERKASKVIADAGPRPELNPRIRAEQSMDAAIERAIAAKTFGVTDEYAAQIRSAAPGLKFDDEDLIGLRAVGVTPAWLAEMSRAGYRPKDIGDLTGARAVGVTGTYIADLAAAGYRDIPLGDLTAMRALSVSGRYIRSLREAGVTNLSIDKLIELRAHNISAAALRQGLRADRPPVPPGSRVAVPEAPEPPEIDPDLDE